MKEFYRNLNNCNNNKTYNNKDEDLAFFKSFQGIVDKNIR